MSKKKMESHKKWPKGMASARPLANRLAIGVPLTMIPMLVCAEPVDITIGVNPEQAISINLSRLLPIAEDNTWEYTRTNNLGTKNVVAKVGSSEKIGGGCLKLPPIVFGDELALYLGNHNDSLSLYGIYLERWKGLSDVLIKFETRYRVDWLDYKPEYVSGPVDETSCQNTGRGRTERTGLVLLEDLTENLGEAGSRRGSLNCKVKNTDLRESMERASNSFYALPGAGVGQTGTGFATVSGASNTLTWIVDSMAINDLGGGEIQILMDFNPILNSSSVDYSIHFDMTLEVGRGITELIITDDGSNVIDDIHDLSYSLNSGGANLNSAENEITPKGSCSEDGSLEWLIMLLSSIGLFRIYTRR